MWNIFVIGFMLLAAYGLYLWLTGQDPESQLRREVNRLRAANKDSAPIVYLRSFASETVQIADIKSALVGKTLAGTGYYWKDLGHCVIDSLRVIAPARELACPETSWR